MTIGAGAGFCGASGTGAMMGLARGAVSGAGAGDATRAAGSAIRAVGAVEGAPAGVGGMVAGAMEFFDDGAFVDGAFVDGAFFDVAFFDGAFVGDAEVLACGCDFIDWGSREMETVVAARVSAGGALAGRLSCAPAGGDRGR